MYIDDGRALHFAVADVAIGLQHVAVAAIGVQFAGEDTRGPAVAWSGDWFRGVDDAVRVRA